MKSINPKKPCTMVNQEPNILPTKSNDQNLSPKGRVSNPKLKLVDHLVERMRTDTGPPRLSHPFTTNCDLTGYARNIFF